MGKFHLDVAWGSSRRWGGGANFSIAETACGAAAMDRRNYFRSCWHASDLSSKLGGSRAEQTSKSLFCLYAFLKATHLHSVLSESTKLGLLQLQANFQLTGAVGSGLLRLWMECWWWPHRDSRLCLENSQFIKKKKKSESVELEGNGHMTVTAVELILTVAGRGCRLPMDPLPGSQKVILDSVLY